MIGRSRSQREQGITISILCTITFAPVFSNIRSTTFPNNIQTLLKVSERYTSRFWNNSTICVHKCNHQSIGDEYPNKYIYMI